MPTKKTLVSAPLIAFGIAVSVSHTASAAVIGDFQFNSAGDTEGWSSANVSGLVADGDSLNGAASSNDPQLTLAGAGLSTTNTWDKIVFRVRETQEEVPAGVVNTFDDLGIVVIFNAINLSGNGFTAVDSGDGFFTVTLDIASFGSTTINSIRLDPIGGAGLSTNSQTNGNSFELDFIQISDVPEPSSFALIGLGALAMIRRRR